MSAATEDTPPFSDSDYPGLYIAADEASARLQKNYIVLIATDLGLMVTASALTVYDLDLGPARIVAFCITGLLLLGSFVLTLVILTRKFEDLWYQGRALAESCKTLTWRFLTRSELFEDGLTPQEARQRFSKRIQDLSEEFPQLNSEMTTELLNKPLITPLMLRVRELTLAARKNYYLNNRIENQKVWYSKKATFNKDKYLIWLAVVMIAQFLSIISIVYLIVSPESKWTFVGLFTTISAASLSWLQLKKHQELKQAYTTTSQELNIISSIAEDIMSENDFSRFVLDSENAISREHTLWLAQRRR